MASHTSVRVKEHTVGADPLVALVCNPHVRGNIDWGFAMGLFRARKVDYFIGRAVDAYVGLEQRGDAEAALAIGAVLEQLRKRQEYEHYFKSSRPVPVNPEDRVKNPAYKAIGSFGH